MNTGNGSTVPSQGAAASCASAPVPQASFKEELKNLGLESPKRQRTGEGEATPADDFQDISSMMSGMAQQDAHSMMLKMFKLMMETHQKLVSQPQGPPAVPPASSSKDSLQVNPELQKILSKHAHEHTDNMHKLVKSTRRLNAINKELEDLEAGTFPSDWKVSKPLQEIQAMETKWEESTETDFLLTMTVPKGSSKSEALLAIQLQQQTWQRRIMASGMQEHVELLKARASKESFFTKLESITVEESYTSKEGFSDAKATKYMKTDSVILSKRDDLHSGALLELEKRLETEDETKRKKQKTERENKAAVASAEPEQNLKIMIQQLAKESIQEQLSKNGLSPGAALGFLRWSGRGNGKGRGGSFKGKGESKGKGKDMDKSKGKDNTKGKGKSQNKDKGKGKGKPRSKGETYGGKGKGW